MDGWKDGCVDGWISVIVRKFLWQLICLDGWIEA